MDENAKNIPKKIVEYIKENRDKFDLIIFQKFINNENTPFYKFGWKRMMGPPETDFSPEMDKVEHTLFVRSTRSCLMDEKFKKLLEENKVDEIFLCGLNTDEAVISTAFDAYDLGYRINIIESLCATYNGKDSHDAAMKLLKEQFEVI
ncbi:MAG: cysteine hydrolase [Candidatus Aenigmarchaeota archaeon]|nr:cysteine hydrolase [Candidatus Aenigmarchaeota archaeon]